MYGKFANFYPLTWFIICCFYLTERYTINHSTILGVELGKTMTNVRYAIPFGKESHFTVPLTAVISGLSNAYKQSLDTAKERGQSKEFI